MFEVAAEPDLTTGMPIVGMGRFDHEPVALDPNTGIISLMEDDENESGLYRFLPKDVSRRVGALEQGGELQMAKVAGENGVDLLDPRIGDRFRVEWVVIDDPDSHHSLMRRRRTRPTTWQAGLSSRAATRAGPLGWRGVGGWNPVPRRPIPPTADDSAASR